MPPRMKAPTCGMGDSCLLHEDLQDFHRIQCLKRLTVQHMFLSVQHSEHPKRL